MRGIRGWIRNLVDGQGPPAGTVDVSAKPLSTGLAELDVTTHRLGSLNVVHLLGGSGSRLKADQTGHFGWDMELSPGKINLDITPHDPQTEYRKRFPDESAQIGKAFITDLERLGWAGGKDHLIWDAVFGGNPAPVASWNNDPLLSATFGNWAIGFGAAAGRVTIRKGIAMLGGVVFSVEINDLVVPITGEAAMPPNAGSQDRWDLFCLRIDWNPDSPEYGKQSFEVTMGSPGAGIPAFPGNSGNYRRLSLHAAKMAPGSDSYSSAYDLRRWNTLASNVPQTKLYSFIPTGGSFETIANWINAGINTNLGTDPFMLPTSAAWDGHGSATFQVDFFDDQTHTPGPFVVWIWTEYQDPVTSEWKLGDYVVKPPAPAGAPPVTPGGSPATNFAWQQWWYLGGVPPAGMANVVNVTIPFAMSRIPPYHVDSALAGTGRSWNKLRFRIMYGSLNGYLYVRQQDLTAQFFPVT